MTRVEKGLGRQKLPKEMPKCLRDGCENRLTAEDMAKGYDHCSDQCYLDDVPDAMGGPEDPL